MPHTTAQHYYNKHGVRSTHFKPDCLSTEKTHALIRLTAGHLEASKKCSNNEQVHPHSLNLHHLRSGHPYHLSSNNGLYLSLPNQRGSRLPFPRPPQRRRRHKKQRLLQHHLSIHQRDRFRNTRKHPGQPAKQQNSDGLHLLPERHSHKPARPR